MSESTENSNERFDISEMTFAPQAKELVLELLSDIGLRLSHSPGKHWPGKNKPDYAGAWICRVGYLGQISLVRNIHGRSITNLLDKGVIEEVSELSEPRRKIYSFSKQALIPENLDTLFRATKLPAGSRRQVRWEDLIETAKLYGVHIEHKRAHGLFQLLTLEGESFREDEYITQNKAGEPVHKINDLTWEEWREILEESAEMIKDMRKQQDN